MMNGKRIALIATAGFCVALVVLWRPILLFGIPVAVITGLAAFALHRSYREDDTRDGERMRRMALVTGVAAGVLALVSVGGNLLSKDGLLSTDRPTESSASTQPAPASHSGSEESASRSRARIDLARSKIEKATRQCRSLYAAYDQSGSGFEECMARRVSDEDYAAVAGAVVSSEQARRAGAMTKSVQYCEEFSHNPTLHGDCLKSEQELRGW
jgi:hypothetical protein